MSNRALILGGSSGIGWAAVEKLVKHDYQIDLIHRDRRQQTMLLKEEIERVSKTHGQISSINCDATNEEVIVNQAQELQKANPKPYKVMLHAISRGNLKPFYGEDMSIGSKDIELTMMAMATSMQIWTRELLKSNLLTEGSKILALTSEGNKRVWDGYGAVAMAKSSLETICQYLAIELASKKITVNILQAGITDTPSLRLIPGVEDMVSQATSRNPYNRLTTPEDVANMIYLMTLPEADWVNGSTIHVDGGEHLR